MKAQCHPDREARCVGLCALCYKKAQHAKHRDAINARKRAARIANGDRIRALANESKQRRAGEVRAQKRASYLKHRATILAKEKANRSEADRASDRTRYHASPDRKKAQAKRWKKAHPEVNAACDHRRRARLAGTASPGVKAAQWRQILAVFGHACAYCLRTNRKLTRDHVEPVARGGVDAPDNVVPACGRCNSRKGAGTLLRFLTLPGALS